MHGKGNWKIARNETRERYRRIGNCSSSQSQSIEFGEHRDRTPSPHRSIGSLWLDRLRSRDGTELQTNRRGKTRRHSSVCSNTVKEATSELRKLSLENQKSQERNRQELTQTAPSTSHELGQNTPARNELSGVSLGNVFFNYDHRRPLGSVEIEPTVAPEVDATGTGPKPCKVTCEQNGRSWVARGRIAKAVPGGNEGLHIWQLGDTMSDRRGYVFGYLDSRWRYVSVSRPGRPLRFESSESDPGGIQLDSNDPRIFCPKSDDRRGISGVILISAKFQDMGVDTDKDGRLVLATDGPNLSSWIISDP